MVNDINKENFFVDNKQRLLSGDNGTNIQFTKYEFNLFYYLLKRKGQVTCTDSIINEVWEYSKIGTYQPDSSNLIQLISKTRRQLKPIEKIVEIKSQRGVGYYLSIHNGYKFNNDEIKRDRITDTPEKSKLSKPNLFTKTRSIEKPIKINKFKLMIIGVIYLLVLSFIWMFLNKKVHYYPDLTLDKDKIILLSKKCNVSEKIIITNDKIKCDELHHFKFKSNKLYILSKSNGNVYATSK
ncbi:helix-turn-helix domain-containing protein [Vibrio paucivorans]